MSLNDFKGKKITVMGIGLHGGGVGTIRFLHEVGAKLIVTDLKSKEELIKSLEKIKDLKNINYVLGQHRPEDFTKVDMVIKNPAAPWSNKYVQMALKGKIPVEMDSSLFFKFCKAPIVGVTGTKGKTTTTSLIFEILKIGGKNPLKVGVGQTSVLDKLKEVKKDSVVVFELSSWRLSAFGRYKLSPQIAVITNIYPDHLNYYKSMEEYIADKKNIFLHQDKEDSAVISADNEAVKGLEGEIKSRLIRFSKNKLAEGKGVYLENGIIYFNNGIDEKKIIEAKGVKLRGEHNLENVLAAIGAAAALGVKVEAIKKAISEFTGVTHRLELVRTLRGVEYFNDTAATTPEAGICALNAFSKPIVLIAGGSDKNLNMGEFGKEIISKVKSVIFLKGVGTDKIISAIKKADGKMAEKEFIIVDSMSKAVELASQEASEGDVVLLSPGSASFGLFVNEFDRGDKFKEAVKAFK